MNISSILLMVRTFNTMKTSCFFLCCFYVLSKLLFVSLSGWGHVLCRLWSDFVPNHRFRCHVNEPWPRGKGQCASNRDDHGCHHQLAGGFGAGWDLWSHSCLDYRARCVSVCTDKETCGIWNNVYIRLNINCAIMTMSVNVMLMLYFQRFQRLNQHLRSMWS